MDTWRLLLHPEPACGARNMAVDEAILEASGRGHALPTLRLYAWQPACLSLGYAQPLGDVDLNRLRQRGWDLVRRPTGGRAVLHIDELTYSVSGPLEEPRLAGTVLESYNRLASVLVDALRTLSLPVRVQENTGSPTRTPNPVCFEMPSTYEITVGGKKLVGSAQARRKEGILQHGSLPLTGDLGRITQVLAFPDEDSRSRAAERLLLRATTIETALGRPVSWEQAAQALVSAFGRGLGLEFQTAELTDWEAKRAAELLEDKYASPGWTENKKDPGT